MIERVLAEQGTQVDGRPRLSAYSTVTPAARISLTAASVVSGATPAHSSMSTDVVKPSPTASMAVRRTQ